MALIKPSQFRIAITINTSWNIYNFRRPLIRSLQEAGYQVICFAPIDEYVNQLAEENMEVHPIHQLQRKGKDPRKDLRLIRELKKAYQNHEIDLAIHFTIKPNIYGSIAAHQTGIPSIAVVTGLGYTFLSHGFSNRAAQLLYRYAFRQNQLTIFQNPDDRALFIQRKLVSPDRSTVILGSGIDTNFFTPHPQPSETFDFLFVGRLLHDKGIRETLEGFMLFSERYPDARLIIVGNQDTQNPASLSDAELSRYQNQDSIEFAGFQSDVRNFIHRASAVLLPSYREGVPRTLLEALSMGRPVITTDVPGCREVIQHGVNGFLIPSHDSRAVAKAMEEFYNLDPATRQIMGQKSRELAEQKFSTRVVNAQYLAVLKQILESNN